jgi:hypothetical protein
MLEVSYISSSFMTLDAERNPEALLQRIDYIKKELQVQ